MFIDGKNIKTKKVKKISPPHKHKHVVAKYYEGNSIHVKNAINAALKAKENWEEMPWEERAAIFLRAAELLAGPYRQKINAATMIGQSKNIFQAEIDASCELIDLLKFNVQFMTDIYRKQPESSKGIWNRMESSTFNDANITYMSFPSFNAFKLKTSVFAGIGRVSAKYIFMLSASTMTLFSCNE